MNAASAEKAFGDLLEQVDLLLARPDAGSGLASRKYADVVSDLLGFLARQMTELHERRQAEVSAFLSWLEQRIGCSVEELSGRTYVREYYTQPGGADRLLEILEQNYPGVSKLDVSLPREYRATNPARELVVQGYQRSLARLEPLLRQLELTDRLIDLLVYRLYGLTSEEIRLVDESTGDPRVPRHP